MDEILHQRLFRLIDDDDVAEFKSLWEELSPEEQREHLDQRDENVGYGLFSMALDELRPEKNASLVVYLIEQGAADPPFNPRQVWNKLHTILAPSSSSALTPELADAAQIVWGALVDRGIGKTDIAGKHWGPQHISANLSYGNEDLAVSRLGHMKKAGYDLDQKDEIGETALLVAAWSASPRVLSFLLDEGADVNACTVGGRDILDFVFRSKESSKKERLEEMAQCLKVLREHGFDVDEAFSRVDEKTMNLWREDYLPVIAQNEADALASTTPMHPASRQPNRSRL